MTNSISDISGKGIRRIVGMILLFAFLGVPLSGQGEVPLTDSLVRNRTFELESPVEQTVPPVEQTIPPVSGTPEPQIFSPEDTTRRSADKRRQEQINREEIEHSPRTAMIYALVLPGLGQAYNKKYFKIPIVYGVMGTAGYWVYFNTQGYRQSSKTYTDDQTDFNLRFLRGWRRQLEISYLTLVATYALQVLDAYVDAHLFHWDVNPDLSIRMEPSMGPLYLPVGQPASSYGISCKLTF